MNQASLALTAKERVSGARQGTNDWSQVVRNNPALEMGLEILDDLLSSDPAEFNEDNEQDFGE